MLTARGLGLAALLAVLAWPVPGATGPFSDALILVARPQLRHPLYARTVLLASPFGANQYYGFILNRRTAFRLSDLFPGHEPSRKVADRVFLGGPVYPRLLFALVESERSPGGGCARMMPGLFAAFDGRAVDRIIEAHPAGRARFFTGFVVWRPGELAREIAGRMWYVLAADASLVQRDPRGLWEDLVVRAQRAGDVLVTGAGAAPRSINQLGGTSLPRSRRLRTQRAPARLKDDLKKRGASCVRSEA